ncbi:hypothetical protein [Pantoea cypripedii]|uniref:Uncharacterized protein n=1 Tax=Pantoea cypripedii TaxID=55209 RepID=A0A6B9G6B2_PANCY|nr:hypothetical protein [Pantoea cypripedii]QGY29797.1 hypothetical protein CUN67_13015 [Pantoea cypripedii]
MSKETGGPAFPTTDPNYDEKWSGSGMDLRDYFAAKLMPAIIGTLNGPVVCEEAKGDFDYYATTAYKMADAMLNARGK